MSEKSIKNYKKKESKKSEHDKKGNYKGNKTV